MGLQMKTLNSQEDLAMLKNLVFVSIISADNDEYSEEVKQEILYRHKKYEYNKEDWDYILEPLGDEAYRYLKILKQ